jgi:hypothetical protein
MKKTALILISIFFVISFAAFAFAGEKIKVKQLTGEVAAVDAAAKSIIVKGKQAEMVFSTDDKITVTANKEKKTLLDVKIGDKITLKYSEINGKNIAKNIEIKNVADDKKTKTAETAKPAKKK